VELLYIFAVGKPVLPDQSLKALTLIVLNADKENRGKRREMS